MAVRDSLPIPPQKQRNESVDIELQRQLEEQREEEAAQQAQMINAQNQQQQVQQQSEIEDTTENPNIEVMIAKAVRYTRSGVIVGGLGLGFVSAFITLIGPVIGAGLLAVAGFLIYKGRALYKKAAALAITQSSYQIKRKFVKKAYNAQTIFFSSCSGCAGIFLTGILFVGFAVVALDMITGVVGNTVSTIVNGLNTATKAVNNTTKQSP